MRRYRSVRTRAADREPNLADNRQPGVVAALPLGVGAATACWPTWHLLRMRSRSHIPASSTGSGVCPLHPLSGRSCPPYQSSGSAICAIACASTGTGIRKIEEKRYKSTRVTREGGHTCKRAQQVGKDYRLWRRADEEGNSITSRSSILKRA